MTVLGLAVATFLIAWLFRHEDPAEVWGHIQDANFWLLGLAALATTAVFPIRAVRWRYFVAPAQVDSPFRSRLAAVCVGFMANNLLPARAGELARAYAYSRLEPVSTATALATLVVERLLDGIAVLVLLLAALASPGFPAETLPEPLVASIQWLSAVLGAILVASLVMLGFPRHSVRIVAAIANALLSKRMATRVIALARNVLEGLRSLRGWRLLVPAFAWSMGLWILQSLSFWIGFFAFGIELSFVAAMLTAATVALAVAIPSAPGFVGTFHVGASLALTDVYGVGEAPALAFAFGWHLAGFFPITLIGLWYARRIGMSMAELRVGQAPASAT